MKKLLTFLTLLTLFFTTGWAQSTVLFHETFGNNPNSARDWNDSYSVKSGLASVYGGITSYTVSNLKQGKNTTGSTLSGINQSTKGTDAYIIIGPLNVSNYNNLGVTYQWKAGSIKGTYYTSLYYSTSANGTYTEVSGTGAGATTFVERAYSLPATAQVSTLYLKIVFNTSNTQAIIDEVELTGETGGSTPTTYSLTLPTGLAGGSVSATGYSDLTAIPSGTNMTVTALPNTGYTLEYMKANGVNVESPFTFSISEDTEITASFAALPTFAISVTNGAADPTTAYEGQTVTLTPNIPSGQMVDWDNTTVSPSTVVIDHSAYTFTMPGQAVTVNFAFKDKPNTVDATFIFNTAAGLGNLGIDIPETPSSGTEIAGTTYKSGDVSFVATNGNQNNTLVFLSSQEKLDLRVYTGGTFTISVPEGSKITNIEFTSENGDKAANATNLSVNSGSMGNNMWTATSDVSTVTFSANNQVRIYTITVSYIAGEAPDVVEYYLAGNLNGWGNPVDPAYKFVEQQDGSFVLNKVLPDMENADNIRFKIAKVVNGGTPVMLGANRSGDDYGINWNNHTDNFELSSASDAAAFSLSDLFNTTFTLNATATSFTVNKPQLFLVGTFNSYATPNNSSLNGAIEMTPAENGGWTLTHEFTDETEFRLYDAWHESHGGNGAWFLEELLGTEFNINNDNDKLSIFHIVGNGNYTITVNSDITKLVADRIPEKYTATIASGITGGTVSFNANSQVSKLNDLPAGYTVNVFVNPQNEDWQLATLTYTAEGSTDAIDITATDGQYSFPMPAANVTINATFNYNGTATLTTYRRITSNDEIEVGKKYLIVNEENNRVQLSGTENSTTININNHETTVSSGSGIGEFVLGSDNNGYYTFCSGGKYLANSGSTTYDIVTTLSDNCYWSISFTEPDADDNVYATIKAKNYNRIVYYFGSTGGYFRTYSASDYVSNVQLYKEVTPSTPEVTLAELCATGVKDKDYIIADKLQAVYAYTKGGNSLLWCKDLGNQSIYPTTIHSGQQIDFMRSTDINYDQGQGVHNGQQGEWDQSNWIVLQFTNPTGPNNIDQMLQDAQDKFIKPGTIKGKLVDDENYILKMDLDMIETLTPADEGYSEVPYIENVYCPANFLPENLNIWGSIENGDGAETSTQNYFFMNPKVQEVCYITYAQWNEAYSCFTVPSTSGIPGAFQVGWVYQEKPLGQENDGTIYKFHAVVHRVGKQGYGPNNPITTKDGMPPIYENITVLPVDLDPVTSVITAINTVETGNGEVKSVKYVNVAGMVSDVPFQGVNIVVTEYTDGSRTTSKMLKK